MLPVNNIKNKNVIFQYTKHKFNKRRFDYSTVNEVNVYIYFFNIYFRVTLNKFNIKKNSIPKEGKKLIVNCQLPSFEDQFAMRFFFLL